MPPEQTIQFKRFSLDKLKQWLHAHPTATYALIGAALIIAGSIVSLILSWKPPVEKVAPAAAPAKIVPPPTYYSVVTGEKVADQASLKKSVTAIMIENSPDARPQSGLKSAEVVYEAIAEGGITRFLAIYQQSKTGLIGPVRSLRPYYISWLTPYDASVAHVGGSAFALQTIRNGQYRDIDQFFNPSTYWRASDRYAPHNVYTNFEKLDALNAQKGYTSSNPTGITRADIAKQPIDARSISIQISSPLYNSSYAFDEASGMYLRSQAGEPHTDRESGQITAKVVIALSVQMSRVFEDGYRENIETTGTGTATIFMDGHATAATWHKDGIGGQLRFTDAAGKDIPLARGITWVTAVPNDRQRVTWQ